MTIPTSNFFTLDEHSNCKIGLDQTIIVYCNDDKWMVIDQFKRLLTAGNQAITDSESIAEAVENAIGRRNVTSYYDFDTKAYKKLTYDGDRTETYFLDKYASNAYLGEYFNYELHPADDPTVLSSDYILDVSDIFHAYVVTQGTDGVLSLNETS